jgi:CheY-like chemotaxis protein
MRFGAALRLNDAVFLKPATLLTTRTPALPLAAGFNALILEPSLLKRQALRRLLRGQGIERVLEAESATEALVLIRGEPVRLVLTPWAPPGMAGVPLLRELKRRPTDRPGAGAIPAIVLLDEGLPRQHVVAAVKAGIAGRLPMPAQPAELVRILSALED